MTGGWVALPVVVGLAIFGLALMWVSIKRQLNQIHTLVNSQHTAALRGQLVALQSNLVLLREGEQSDSRQATAEAVETQIDELSADLEDRLRAQAAA